MSRAQKAAQNEEEPEEQMEETAGAGEEAAFSQGLKQRESKVQGALSGGRTKDALVAALDNPPLGTKSDQVKDNSADLVANVLQTVKAADVKAHLEGLNDDQCDLLLKYIYRAMQNADNSAALLAWHAAIVERCGLGSIVRAFAERKTVC